MGKSKKEKRKSESGDVTLEGESESKSYEDKIRFLNPISQPLASRKLTRKLLKVTRKGVWKSQTFVLVRGQGKFSNSLVFRKINLSEQFNAIIAHEVKSLCKGIKTVQKYIKKGGKGLVVLAGDVFPIEIFSHIPIACEEAGISYCYVPSKEDLGSACGSANQCIMVLVKKHEDIEEIYDECCTAVQELPLPI